MSGKQQIWVSLILSICAFICGLTMVLIFIRHYVVKYITEESYIQSKCLVSAITMESSVHIQTCTISIVKGTDGSWVSCQTAENCVKIKVNYIDDEKEWQSGILYPRPRSNVSELAETEECVCLGCNHIHHPHLHKAEYNTTSIYFSNQWFTRGLIIPCYYNPRRSGAAFMEKQVKPWLLQAILWPTLLFIAGFVGAFFACILFQKEGLNCKKEIYKIEDAVAV